MVKNLHGAKSTHFEKRPPYSSTPSRFGSTSQAGAEEIRLFGDMPTVVFSEIAWRTMCSYIDLINTEIGWLGTVTRTGNKFQVDAVYLAEQEVSGTETLITEAGFNRLMVELLAETAHDPMVARQLVDAAVDSEALEVVVEDLVENYGCDMQSMMTRGNTIRFWGHSHVNMSINPSGTDDTAMEAFQDQGFSFMLRGIFNKRGQVRIDLFDYQREMMILNIAYQVKWDAIDDSAAIAAEIASKVTAKTYPTYRGKYRGVMGTYLSHFDPDNGWGDPDESGEDWSDLVSKPLPSKESILDLLDECRASEVDSLMALHEKGLLVDDAGNICCAVSGEIVVNDVFAPLSHETIIGT